MERLLKLFPGLLAGGLAIVYVLGAIATGSEFSGAGIDPRDAVPLLSVDQLLARGIGVLVKPTAFVLLLGASFLVLNVLVLQVFQQRASAYSGDDSDLNEIRIDVFFGLSMTMVVVIFTPLNQMVGYLILAITLWAGVFLPTVSRSMPRQWQRLFPLVIVIGLVLSEGVLAYMDPAPLGMVSLELRREQMQEGVFVTHSDSTWYLYNRDRGEIKAFADDSVESATLDERPDSSSNDDKSLGTYAWDALTDALPT